MTSMVVPNRACVVDTHADVELSVVSKRTQGARRREPPNDSMPLCLLRELLFEANTLSIRPPSARRSCVCALALHSGGVLKTCAY